MSVLSPLFKRFQCSPTEQLLKDMGCRYTRRADGVLVVKRDMDLSNRRLTVLPDLSSVIVEGSFLCNNNQLTSLAGAPRSVGEHFLCHDNLLTNLRGASRDVGWNFFCSENPLTDLEGIPQKFQKIFSDWGKFSSLEEIPEDIRLSPETRARLQREAEEEHQKYLRDTDAGLGLRREIPLPPRIRWKSSGQT